MKYEKGEEVIPNQYITATEGNTQTRTLVYETDTRSISCKVLKILHNVTLPTIH